MTTLPIGSGRYTVFGIPAIERDDNRQLTSRDQDATNQETPVYCTDNIEEARGLVREGGFSHQGTFYATTRFAEGASAAASEATLKRDDPSMR